MGVMRKKYGGWQAGLLVMAAGLTACDSGGGDPYQPASLAEGVVFTYPLNGQTDVPLATRFYVTFSKAVSASAVGAACSVDSGGTVTGNFCLVGPGNTLVSISPSVSGKVVQFETGSLSQGSEYALHVRGAVIGGGSTNLSGTDPLITFTTSQIDPVAGTVPAVRAINGEAPDVYSSVLPTPPSPRYPFMDFATVRVEFSEPLDEKTVVMNASFEFVAVDGSTETPVAGSLVVRKQHVSFDPDDDLTPGTTYRLRLGSGIQDLNGEAVVPVTYELVPEEANACNCVITQHFNTTVAFGESGFPATSILTGRPINAIDLYSPLIGSNDINLLDSTLQAELADPADFNGLIPFVIRKGNTLSITGLDLALGGAVSANLGTGAIKATFLSDATGFMGRNPYRSADTKPDDDKAPVFVYLIFDLALTGSDADGNAVLNQTIPHVQATGTARVVDGNLHIETVRTLTMDLLGLDLAPAHMVLGINSDLNGSVAADTDAPQITGAYPADGAVDFPVRDGLSLIFNEPIDNAGLVAGDQISLIDRDNGNAAVPFQLAYDGSTILLKPTSALTFGHDYRITLSGLTDMSPDHNALSLDGSDASGGDGIIDFTAENPLSTTVGPMVSSIHTGAACVLTGSSYASPGHCAGGDSGDTAYLPFDMPADGFLDVQFSQPMNVSTLALGTSCGSGRVRVEAVDGSGTCTGVVAGTLTADTRSMRFKPTQPWTPGSNYRLTLVPGGDATCTSASEICGNNNEPLNPDPLNGGEGADAGGSNIVMRFVGVAANDDSAVYLPLKMEPVTDINGNGFRDGGETVRTENSASVAVVPGAFTGIVTGAAIEGDSHIYLSGSLPVTVGLPEPISIDGATWGISLAGDSQIPVQVNPGILYGTSITMSSSAVVLGFLSIPIEDVATGLSVLRLRQSGDAPVMGYIVQEDGVDAPQFVSQMDLYMDAPDMTIQVDIPLLGGLVSINHNLHSLPLTAIVKGPITFMPDGRIVIEQANVNDIDLTISISSIAGSGTIGLRIPAGAMQLQLTGNPLKGRR